MFPMAPFGNIIELAGRSMNYDILLSCGFAAVNFEFKGSAVYCSQSGQNILCCGRLYAEFDVKILGRKSAIATNI